MTIICDPCLGGSSKYGSMRWRNSSAARILGCVPRCVWVTTKEGCWFYNWFDAYNCAIIKIYLQNEHPTSKRIANTTGRLVKEEIYTL